MPKSNFLLAILPLFWPKMPPLGLGFLQAFLAKREIDADILDLNNHFYNLSGPELKRQWLISCNASLQSDMMPLLRKKHLPEYRAAVGRMLDYSSVGFSCFQSNLSVTLEIAALLKSKRKDIRIILGGPEMARQFFKGKGKMGREITGAADLTIVGEGEGALADYLEGKSKERTIVFKQLADLSGLPFPKYSGLNFNAYPRKDAVPMLLSRGCVRSCFFCSERLLYRGFRARSIESAIAEMRYHQEANNTRYFVFFDSLINADLELLENFCDAIIASFGAVNWEAQIAVRDDMQPRIFAKLKQSGCYNLFVGLESGSDATLKKMNKGFTVAQASGFFQKMQSAGLSFGISVIVGYPGETEADFQESLRFIIRNRGLIPKIEQVNPFTYYEGTVADRKGDYRHSRHSAERMETFVREIKKYHFKHTNAFLGNLIEKHAGI